MLQRKKGSRKLLAGFLAAGLFLTGCSAEVSNVSHAKEMKTEWTGQVEADETDSYSLVGAYDSADTAVVYEVDEASKQITLTNLYTGRDYKLHYSGTSYVMDKYGSAMTAGQLKQGQIVDVTFLKSNRQINTLQVSADAWKYDEVEKYNLTGINGTATIGSAVYSLGADARIFSNGHQSDLMDIVKGDVLTISGVGHDIYSICIEKGHGYVRLKNDHNLVGGWIEIGSKVITRVSSENMLLVVPEGSYTVKMYNEVSSANKEIKVERNQELVLDCSEIKANEDMKGFVRLHVTPENAEVQIDSKVVGIEAPVELSYGIHQIEVSAEGYQTLSKYISVGAGYAEITIVLEKSLEEDEDDASEFLPDQNGTGDKKNPFESEEIGLPETENTVSDNDSSVSKNDVVSAKTTNKVYIDAPQEVEVFVDGIYQGLTPMSFKKAAGNHTVVLRKAGYVTRSYTIYLYDDGQDITYSFSDLEPDGTLEEQNEPEEPEESEKDKPDSPPADTPSDKGDEETKKDDTPPASPPADEDKKEDPDTNEENSTAGEVGENTVETTENPSDLPENDNKNSENAAEKPDLP